jgi:signal transduction histidine kinase
VEAFRPLAAAREATVVLDIPDTLTVRAERNALRQVLLNLLDNAIKYGPVGQEVRVEGRDAADGRGVVLAVEDQGPGVPLGDRERIWEGFERLEREDAPVAGSGIGLAVVRALAARMGGETAVGDAPTGGARFTVRLERAGADGG